MKKIRIYQLDEKNPMAKSLKFLSYDTVNEIVNGELKQDLYKVVYDGEVEDDLDLDGIYQRFNIGRKPEDYKGHSLSTSDIVYMDEKFWFCNDFGWVEVKWKQFLVKANGKVVAKAACVGDLVEKADAFEKTIKGQYKRETCKFSEQEGMYPGICFTLFEEEPKKKYIVTSGDCYYESIHETREEAEKRCEEVSLNDKLHRCWFVEEVIDEDSKAIRFSPKDVPQEEVA